MILERYAFYSKSITTPAGNFEHCFFVGDTADPPVVDGVTIPREFYEVRQEIEINLSHCTVKQLQGILCKYLSNESERLIQTKKNFVKFDFRFIVPRLYLWT